MRFRKIKYYNFRNIGNISLNVDSENVILEGINGQGKTNILESVYALCYGSSFRTQNFKEMIKIGEKSMRIQGEIVNDDDLSLTIEYIVKDGKRTILLNSKEVRDRKELVYNFPCIVFSHDDINFIKGDPECRRRFFDQTISMHDPLYLDDLRKYRAILTKRNAAIKNMQFYLVPLYDERLARHGFEIEKKRKACVEDFNSLFPSLYKKVSKTEKTIKIEYKPSWADFDGVDEIVSHLSSSMEKDKKMMTTTSGIHRDRFIVVDENGPFSQTGSTGQIRLSSLLFRVAEAKYFSKKTKKKPILLIDDVLLELDSAKREKFLSELDNYSQAFYTFLPMESYFGKKRDNSLRYVVSGGYV